MEQNNKLIFKPSKKQFKELEKELKAEYTTFQTGFYVNWNVIENCFKRGDLILFEKDKQIVGFATSNIWQLTVNIVLFQILKPYERKGLGTIFFNLFEAYIKSENYKVVYLNCEPWESETFWRKQGFQTLEVLGIYLPRLSLYKPLVECAIPVKESNSGNKIEIWDKPVHLCKDIPPKWIFETNSITKPILLPIWNEWKLRWTKNGIIQYDHVLKRFTKQFEIDFSPFVFVDKLPE